MIPLTAAQIATILSADYIHPQDVCVTNVNTDSRQQSPNSLFIALKGERFDGHQYLESAVANGAVALVVEQANSTLNVPQLIVADTRLALGRLGQWLMAHLSPKTVAMTGSSGKTTVKEMTAAILSCAGNVLFTQGNFNNDIGVPLTLLRLEPTHDFAVIELGANHLGEIAYTSSLVKPDVAMVNNVAPAHLEGFGSLDGVARAKGEIYQGLKEAGIALVNLDCHYLDQYWKKTIGARQLYRFSVTQTDADFYTKALHLHQTGASFILVTPQGEIDIELPYLGQHNVSNAVAAAALSMLAGATLSQIQQGLAQRQWVKGRLYPIEVHPNLLLLDDCYNANVDSMQSAIRVLSQYQDTYKILVVGDMAELGEESLQCHQIVADFAHSMKLDLVFSLGDQSAVISQRNAGQHFADKDALSNALVKILKQKTQNKVVVLFKGSRSMRMEEIISPLKDRLC